VTSVVILDAPSNLGLRPPEEGFAPADVVVPGVQAPDEGVDG
jgi:hypothetical protein